MNQLHVLKDCANHNIGHELVPIVTMDPNSSQSANAAAAAAAAAAIAANSSGATATTNLSSLTGIGITTSLDGSGLLPESVLDGVVPQLIQITTNSGLSSNNSSFIGPVSSSTGQASASTITGTLLPQQQSQQEQTSLFNSNINTNSNNLNTITSSLINNNNDQQSTTTTINNVEYDPTNILQQSIVVQNVLTGVYTLPEEPELESEENQTPI
ncbi:probable serine/threonine-protein kinase DDB_G0267686 [Condylostylus longicornis]|uniref:probable serine/threonine-protein kinase DDB_G0267686 n=1 Tax=Condylostylus longicornis TaxID=2530218 RepID=UPI00244D99F7|nr:probable serine/threonine-protein kinase DDB_G0267686 [Condylostylus longicornis]